MDDLHKKTAIKSQINEFHVSRGERLVVLGYLSYTFHLLKAKHNHAVHVQPVTSVDKSNFGMFKMTVHPVWKTILLKLG